MWELTPDIAPEDAQYGVYNSFQMAPCGILSSSSSMWATLEQNDEPKEKPKKHGRKGHTKSRAGCYNCKRARIKCKENRPACDYCSHRDLKCEWPAVQIAQTVPAIRNAEPMSMILANPQTPAPVFTSQDFRLFNHFIQVSYPQYPPGNDSIWTHEIPSIASSYDFLLHAMLALSASEINASTNDQQLTVTAMSHRVKSIEAFNAAISRGFNSFEEGNAMIATCFTLLFQSVLMNDGLPEYMAFIRGTLAIGERMWKGQMKLIFTNMLGDEAVQAIEPALNAAPLIRADVVSAACRALETIAPLCQGPTELELYGTLLNMARTLITSSKEAYMELRKFYTIFMTMPHAEFRHFTDPANDIGRLLQAHFIALQMVMTPITRSEQSLGKKAEKAAFSGPQASTGRWLATIHAGIPDYLRDYFAWTLWIEKEVEHGKIYNGVYND